MRARPAKQQLLLAAALHRHQLGPDLVRVERGAIGEMSQQPHLMVDQVVPGLLHQVGYRARVQRAQRILAELRGRNDRAVSDLEALVPERRQDCLAQFLLGARLGARYLP
jgi:hypothetical protein